MIKKYMFTMCVCVRARVCGGVRTDVTDL